MRNRIGFVGCGFIVAAMMLSSVSGQPYWGWNWWGTTTNPLGLTAEQMNQIQNLVGEWQKEMLPLWSNLQARSQELQRLRWDVKTDPALVEEKTREVGELQARMQRKLLERRAAIRGVLTEEQKSRYDAQSLGYGFGRGPCGQGLGRSSGVGFGWRRGPGWRTAAPNGVGFYGRRWGAGPCGMGLGRVGW